MTLLRLGHVAARAALARGAAHAGDGEGSAWRGSAWSARGSSRLLVARRDSNARSPSRPASSCPCRTSFFDRVSATTQQERQPRAARSRADPAARAAGVSRTCFEERDRLAVLHELVDSPSFTSPARASAPSTCSSARRSSRRRRTDRDGSARPRARRARAARRGCAPPRLLDERSARGTPARRT